MRKIKEQTASGGKKKYPKPDGLLELEKALNESKDTATAVSGIFLLLTFIFSVCVFIYCIDRARSLDFYTHTKMNTPLTFL